MLTVAALAVVSIFGFGLAVEQADLLENFDGDCPDSTNSSTSLLQVNLGLKRATVDSVSIFGDAGVSGPQVAANVAAERSTWNGGRPGNRGRSGRTKSTKKRMGVKDRSPQHDRNQTIGPKDFKASPNPGRFLTFGILGIVLASLCCICTDTDPAHDLCKDSHAAEASLLQRRTSAPRRRRTMYDRGEGYEEHFVCEPENLDEDVYCFAICSLVRDGIRVCEGRGRSGLRVARLLIAQSMLFLNIALQAYLMYTILLLCASGSVTSIRGTYNEYEFWMYGQNISHMRNTTDGSQRGNAQHFQPDAFKSMDDAQKKEVCQIPLSQPIFLCMILFVWTLTCVTEVKALVQHFCCLIINTPTQESLLGALDLAHDDDQTEATQETVLRRCADMAIVHLTLPAKVYIVLGILLPRLILTLFLLWIGCRWLAATNDFAELVLNAVALEFVLQLKGLLYYALVPARNKRELRHTFTQPASHYEAVTAAFFLGDFLWFFIAALWCLCYVYYFQHVLLDYNWDVRMPCQEWLKAQPH